MRTLGLTIMILALLSNTVMASELSHRIANPALYSTEIWEYRVVPLDSIGNSNRIGNDVIFVRGVKGNDKNDQGTIDATTLEWSLNQLGLDGWTLVTILEESRLAIFKRMVSPIQFNYEDPPVVHLIY